MRTYIFIQVAYPIIMNQNWSEGAEARGGGGGAGMEENFAILEYE